MGLFRLFTPTETVAIVIACAMLSTMYGFLMHGIMGKRGFGPMRNAVIVATGVFLGLTVSHMWLGPLDPRNPGHMASVSLIGGTGLLIFAGFAKRFIFG
jgi:uncharacterized membrane protein YphA (DoxX/SURF4 family)